MQIKSYFAIFIGLSSAIQSCSSDADRQMPQPDLSALKDDGGTLPESDDFLPAVMMAIQHFTENMQYEQVQVQADDVTQRPIQQTTKRPAVTATTRRTTTTTTTTQRPTTKTTTTKRTTTQKRTTAAATTQRQTTKTTQRPTTTKWTPRTTPNKFPYTTEINILLNHPSTPRPHKPGNYQPEQPSYYQWTYFGVPLKPEQNYHRPGVQQPQVGINSLSDPDWKDPAFFQWFFQPKPKELEPFDENELQYLDPLPKKLLIDQHHESSRPTALLDLDNVNEFRKQYDDSYLLRIVEPNMQHMRMQMKLQMQQQRLTVTGRKKPPPTRPYVHMLMLYDLLKREAKSKKLHQFGGFTPALLNTLHESSQYTGDYQMKFLLQTMLDRKEVTAADVLSRANFVITDLEDEKSVTFKTLQMIPPLQFLP